MITTLITGLVMPTAGGVAPMDDDPESVPADASPGAATAAVDASRPTAANFAPVVAGRAVNSATVRACTRCRPVTRCWGVRRRTAPLRAFDPLMADSSSPLTIASRGRSGDFQ